MNTFPRDMAIERIEDFKYLSARVNTIMSEYMDREEYFVKDKDLFEKWLANRPTLHIHYLDSNENIRMEIDHTIGRSSIVSVNSGMRFNERTLGFSLISRPDGFMCSPSYFPSVIFWTHIEDIANYICYFAKLQNVGKVRIAFIKAGLIDVDDSYLKEHLGIKECYT